MKEQNYIRNTLAVLGILLPILCLVFNLIFGSEYNQPYAQTLTSISAAHYTNSYLLFEGLLFAMGLFFILYRGYNKADHAVSLIIGISAIFLALFPCARDVGNSRNFVMASKETADLIHFIMSLTFFAGLIFMTGARFTKKNGAITKQKKQRNILYIICAIIMGISLVIGYAGKNIFNWTYFLYIGETVTFWAFGLAWLTKGGVFLRDA